MSETKDKGTMVQNYNESIIMEKISENDDCSAKKDDNYDKDITEKKVLYDKDGFKEEQLEKTVNNVKVVNEDNKKNNNNDEEKSIKENEETIKANKTTIEQKKEENNKFLKDKENLAKDKENNEEEIFTKNNIKRSLKNTNAETNELDVKALYKQVENFFSEKAIIVSLNKVALNKENNQSGEKTLKEKDINNFVGMDFFNENSEIKKIKESNRILIPRYETLIEEGKEEKERTEKRHKTFIEKDEEDLKKEKEDLAKEKENLEKNYNAKIEKNNNLIKANEAKIEKIQEENNKFLKENENLAKEKENLEKNYNAKIEKNNNLIKANEAKIEKIQEENNNCLKANEDLAKEKEESIKKLEEDKEKSIKEKEKDLQQTIDRKNKAIEEVEKKIKEAQEYKDNIIQKNNEEIEKLTEKSKIDVNKDIESFNVSFGTFLKENKIISKVIQEINKKTISDSDEISDDDQKEDQDEKDIKYIYNIKIEIDGHTYLCLFKNNHIFDIIEVKFKDNKVEKANLVCRGVFEKEDKQLTVINGRVFGNNGSTLDTGFNNNGDFTDFKNNKDKDKTKYNTACYYHKHFDLGGGDYKNNSNNNSVFIDSKTGISYLIGLDDGKLRAGDGNIEMMYYAKDQEGAMAPSLLIGNISKKDQTKYVFGEQTIKTTEKYSNRPMSIKIKGKSNENGKIDYEKDISLEIKKIKYGYTLQRTTQTIDKINCQGKNPLTDKIDLKEQKNKSIAHCTMIDKQIKPDGSITTTTTEYNGQLCVAKENGYQVVKNGHCKEIIEECTNCEPIKKNDKITGFKYTSAAMNDVTLTHEYNRTIRYGNYKRGVKYNMIEKTINIDPLEKKEANTTVSYKWYLKGISGITDKNKKAGQKDLLNNISEQAFNKGKFDNVQNYKNDDDIDDYIEDVKFCKTEYNEGYYYFNDKKDEPFFKKTAYPYKDDKGQYVYFIKDPKDDFYLQVDFDNQKDQPFDAETMRKVKYHIVYNIDNRWFMKVSNGPIIYREIDNDIKNKILSNKDERKKFFDVQNIIELIEDDNKVYSKQTVFFASKDGCSYYIPDSVFSNISINNKYSIPIEENKKLEDATKYKYEDKEDEERSLYYNKTNDQFMISNKKAYYKKNNYIAQKVEYEKKEEETGVLKYSGKQENDFHVDKYHIVFKGKIFFSVDKNKKVTNVLSKEDQDQYTIVNGNDSLNELYYVIEKPDDNRSSQRDGIIIAKGTNGDLYLLYRGKFINNKPNIGLFFDQNRKQLGTYLYDKFKEQIKSKCDKVNKGDILDISQCSTNYDCEVSLAIPNNKEDRENAKPYVQTSLDKFVDKLGTSKEKGTYKDLLDDSGQNISDFLEEVCDKGEELNDIAKIIFGKQTLKKKEEKECIQEKYDEWDRKNEKGTLLRERAEEARDKRNNIDHLVDALRELDLSRVELDPRSEDNKYKKVQYDINWDRYYMLLNEAERMMKNNESCSFSPYKSPIHNRAHRLYDYIKNKRFTQNKDKIKSDLEGIRDIKSGTFLGF